MDSRFAEFVGIFIGDGSLYVRETKHSYEFKFTGNIKDEIPYYDFVSKLAAGIVHRSIQTKILDAGRSVGLYFCSKKLAERFHGLGICPGPKAEKVAIPEEIMEKQNLAIACIRGILDTDGCFTLKKGGKYPVVAIAMKNRTVLSQIKRVLGKLGIGSCISFDVSYFDKRTNKCYSEHFLWINGRKNTEKWFKIIGTNNPKMLERYMDYKKSV